jgi:hypothetical protein
MTEATTMTIDRTEEYQAKGIVGEHDAVIEHVGVGVHIKRGVGDLFIRDDDPTVQKLKARDEENARREAAGDIRCQHCDEWFTPRTGSGGKPAKFCSTECRRAADAERKANAPNARQRASGMTEAEAVAYAEKAAKATLANLQRDEASDFDWRADDCVVLQEQAETAIYFNDSGGLVIRQRNWPHEDQTVIITKECIEAFHDKLCDALGIGSIGRCD